MLKIFVATLASLAISSVCYAEKPSLSLYTGLGFGQEAISTIDDNVSSGNIAYEVGIVGLYDVKGVEADKGDLKYGFEVNNGSKTEFIRRYYDNNVDHGAFVAPEVNPSAYSEAKVITQYNVGDRSYRLGAGLALDRGVVRPVLSGTALKCLGGGKRVFGKLSVDGFETSATSREGFYEFAGIIGLETSVESLSK